MTIITRQSCQAILALCVVATLTACGGNPVRDGKGSNTPYEVSEDYEANVIRYTVQGGDRLSDIALEFTGEQSKWRAIADHNGISNPRRMRVGAILEIPTELIPGYAEKRSNRRLLANNRQQATDEQTPSKASEQLIASSVSSASSSLAVKRTPQVVGPADTVVVQPVESNRNFNMKPIDADTASGDGVTTMINGNRLVRVIGSYYPKGVYKEPVAYSDLLMRVTPGTVFSLDRQVEGWYKIMTDRGVGYLRDVDGMIEAASSQ